MYALLFEATYCMRVVWSHIVSVIAGVMGVAPFFSLLMKKQYEMAHIDVQTAVSVDLFFFLLGKSLMF